MNEAFIDIEKIRKHRISNGVNEYLVKWKGLLEEDNTWVTQSEITQEELDDYNEHKSPSYIEIYLMELILKEISSFARITITVPCLILMKVVISKEVSQNLLKLVNSIY